MIVSCENCDTEFSKKPADIKRTKHNLCSKVCTGLLRMKNTKLDFMSRYDVAVSGCFEWTGAVNASGYGIQRYERKVQLAHRVSYEINIGPIGDLLVCHSCDNPLCINPSHLFLGTHQDNMDDMFCKERKWTKLTFDNVRYIRDSMESGAMLAVKFKVSERAIRMARSSNHWKPVATHWQPLPAAPETK